MTNETTKRDKVIQTLVAIMELEYLSDLCKPDFSRWAVSVYAALEAMAAEDAGADITARKNCLCVTGFDYSGKHVIMSSRDSSNPSGDAFLMENFLELEQAHRLRQVEIKPRKLGTLWISSAVPKIVDLFPNAHKIGVSSTPEMGTGAELEPVVITGTTCISNITIVDRAQAGTWEHTPESMILSQAQRLIDRADSFGVVVSIQNMPLRPLAMGNFVMVPSVYSRQAKHVKTPGEHVLYKDGDSDIPEVICDTNGQIVLGLCRLCGRGESQLEGEPCPGHKGDQS